MQFINSLIQALKTRKPPTYKRGKTSSEVLLLETVMIANQHKWHPFVFELYKHRARQHVRVLLASHRTEKKVQPNTVTVISLRRFIKQAQAVERDIIKEVEDFSTLTLLDQYSKFEKLLEEFFENIGSLPDQMQEDIDIWLCEEHRRAMVKGIGNSIDIDIENHSSQQTLHAHALIGLAISGGGIRSASFSVGILESIAKTGLLPIFHYISSVSGGGYASSWLVAWAYRDRQGISGVQKELYTRHGGEAGPLRWVRRYSSYLAPSFGHILSGDAWALLVAYISNWLPIFLLVLLALITVLLVPHCVMATSEWILRLEPNDTSFDFMSWSAIVPMILFMGLIKRLTLFYREPNEVARFPKGLSQLVVGASLIVALDLTVAVPVLSTAIVDELSEGIGQIVPRLNFADVLTTLGLYWLALQGVTSLIGYLLSTDSAQSCVDWFRRTFQGVSHIRGPLKWQRTPVMRLLVGNAVAATVGAVLSTIVLTYGFAAKDADVMVTVGPLVVVVIFSTAELAGNLFTQKFQRDVDRAWSARLGGWMLSSSVIWTAVSAISLLSEHLLKGSLDSKETAALSLAGALLVGIWAWKLRKRGGSMYAYAVVLFFCFLVHLALVPLVTTIRSRGALDIWYALIVVLAATLIVGALSNVNRFSLHALYKEGLVRTFLAASRLSSRNVRVSAPNGAIDPEARQFRARRPDPVTNIDDDDNPELSWLTPRPERDLPLILLNAAVNGRSHTDVDGRVPRQWPFTFSPYFCGSPVSGIGYTETSRFFTEGAAKGITLGTAMAVSGAAMSPTAGHTTHPIRAFVLGILNARLGLWVGNPKYLDTVRRDRPSLTGLAVLQEILGLRTRFSRWIHLSDGGHFENLGVYELVRRGCRRIICVDASCDPRYELGDLANAIRRVYIDLGIKISRDSNIDRQNASASLFTDAPISATDGHSQWFEIDYGDRLPKGRLLYIKPVLLAGAKIPVQVTQYQKSSPNFPHETTADQFFSEAQMEAYRSLGFACGDAVLSEVLKIEGPAGSMHDKRLLDLLLHASMKSKVL